MSPDRKRKVHISELSVSPPPPTRRKVQPVLTDQGNENEGPQSRIRVFSWNVNGTKPLLQKKISFHKDDLYPLRAFLKRHSWPHFLCLQEVKISPRDEATQRNVQQAANVGSLVSEPSYTVHFSLPRDKYNATGFGGKVYGVATLIRDDIAEHVVSTWRPDWDLEGRVLLHEMNHTSAVILINGYWVNGTSNPYRNPKTGNSDGTRHDHKLRFHRWMLEECQKFQKQGKQVVLVGDMNVARNEIDGHPNLRTSPTQHIQNRVDFNGKFFTDPEGLCGVDVFREMHGSSKKYTYHPRGGVWGHSCDRVDNIIVTRGLFDAGAVSRTDICDNVLDRGHSDHVPLWVEIDLSKVPDVQNASASMTVGGKESETATDLH